MNFVYSCAAPKYDHEAVQSGVLRMDAAASASLATLLQSWNSHSPEHTPP